MLHKAPIQPGHASQFLRGPLDDHARRLSRALAGFALVTALSGCATSEQTWTTSNITVHGDGRMIVDAKSQGTKGEREFKYMLGTTLRHRMPQHIYLARPVDGVFIGVSNFGEKAGKEITPAHALGAALSYSLHFQAAARAPNPSNIHSPTIGHVATIGESRVELRADLRLSPFNPAWKAKDVEQLLDSMPGVSPFKYSDVFRIPKNELWQYMQSETLTKAKILQLARDQAARLAARPEKNKAVGIFYLATHGALGPDGKRYAVAADSVADDFSTWIDYQELVDIFSAPFDPALPVSMLILFDTCLSGEVPEDDAHIKPHGGSVVLSAAAPGQYSWHWNQVTELELISASEGSGASKRTFGPRSLSTYSTLSVVPVAMAETLRRVEEFCAAEPSNEVEELTSPIFLQAVKRLVTHLAGTVKGDAERIQRAQSFADAVTTTHIQADMPVSPEAYALYSLKCEKPDKKPF